MNTRRRRGSGEVSVVGVDAFTEICWPLWFAKRPDWAAIQCLRPARIGEWVRFYRANITSPGWPAPPASASGNLRNNFEIQSKIFVFLA